ncbi:MAG: hypothetical protein WBB98_04485 [Xanthobacteraceae bacterium]
MSIMTLAFGDDWTGIYVDGDLFQSGHCVDAFDAVSIAIEKGVTEVYEREVDIDWLHEDGDLPQRIEDVKWSSATQVAEAA